MTYEEACMAINMIPGVGPVRLRKMLDVFAEPQDILHARASKLETVPGIGPEIARQIAAWESTVDLPGEIQRVSEAGVKVLTQQSEFYPALLRSDSRSAHRSLLLG